MQGDEGHVHLAGHLHQPHKEILPDVQLRHLVSQFPQSLCLWPLPISGRPLSPARSPPKSKSTLAISYITFAFSSAGAKSPSSSISNSSSYPFTGAYPFPHFLDELQYLPGPGIPGVDDEIRMLLRDQGVTHPPTLAAAAIDHFAGMVTLAVLEDASGGMAGQWLRRFSPSLVPTTFGRKLFPVADSSSSWALYIIPVMREEQ